MAHLMLKDTLMGGFLYMQQRRKSPPEVHGWCGWADQRWGQARRSQNQPCEHRKWGLHQPSLQCTLNVSNTKQLTDVMARKRQVASTGTTSKGAWSTGTTHSHRRGWNSCWILSIDSMVFWQATYRSQRMMLKMIHNQLGSELYNRPYW